MTGILIVWLVVTAESWGIPPAEVQAIWDARFAGQETAVRELDAELRAVDAELAKARGNRAKSLNRKPKAQVQEIADLERRATVVRLQLDGILQSKFSRLEIDCFAPRVGDVGRLNYPDGTVGAVPHRFRVFQILGPQSMLIRLGRIQAAVEGVTTAGLVDDGNVTLAMPLKVTGTKTYQTAVGATRTVFVLEPYDLTEFERWLPQLQLTLWRRWTDRTGKHSTIAKVVHRDSDRLTLEKLDGSRVDLQLPQLSEADQKFIHSPYEKEPAHGAKND